MRRGHVMRSWVYYVQINTFPRKSPAQLTRARLAVIFHTAAEEATKRSLALQVCVCLNSESVSITGFASDVLMSQVMQILGILTTPPLRTEMAIVHHR